MQIESLLDTLNRVAKILDNPSTSEISTESKVDLTKAANAINDLVRSAQEQLDNNDTVSLENLKNAADKIIIGALIYVIAADDNKYAFQAGGYYDQCKYPRFLSYIMSGIERNKPAVDLFTFIGNRALCLKDLPFTGNFAHDFGGVFNELNSVFDQKYFDNYELNTDPATTSTSDLKSQESTKKAEARKLNKLKRALNIDCDPNSPLNDSFYKNIGVQTPRQEYEVKMERRKQLMDSETSKLNTQQLKIYIYKTLSYILAPFTLFISLLITRPWIEKKQQEVDELFANRKWVEKDIPIEEYKEIQNKRADLKATFAESADLEKSAKPHKVCIGLNEAGHKTTILAEVKTVRMWCDKAQANRWSLSFLNKSAQQDYQNSVIESIQLQEEIAPSGGYNC